MHEGLGAVTFAILPDARVNDSNGAGAIIMVVYPNNDEEKKEFEKILINHSKGIFQYHGDNKIIVFDDLPEVI